MLTSFCYLGRNITAADDYCTEFVGNIRKERWTWVQLLWVLGMEEVDTRTSGILYLIVVQSIQLFVSEMWVATPCIDKIRGGGLGVTTRSRGVSHRRNLSNDSMEAIIIPCWWRLCGGVVGGTVNVYLQGRKHYFSI